MREREEEKATERKGGQGQKGDGGHTHMYAHTHMMNWPDIKVHSHCTVFRAS